MQNEKFYRFGLLIYIMRWPLLVLAFFALICCIPFLSDITTPYHSTGFIAEDSASAKANNYLMSKLGYDHNRFIVIYQSSHLLATSNSFNNAIKSSLSQLKNFPYQSQIIYPNDNKNQISKDKHTAYAVVLIKKSSNLTSGELNQFKSSIKTPANMHVIVGGEPMFMNAVDKQMQVDLFKADYYAAPMSILTMLIVFGSVIAALLPVLLGGGCAILILTVLYFFGHLFSLSIFTINIALLLGLCLTLDYALFIINRFKQELLKNPVDKALAITQATAGKAVFFSGLSVFISLSALLLFPVNVLFSVGIGGLVAVFTAVILALFVLPALLSVLDGKINWLPIPVLNVENDGSSPFWRALVTRVVSRPFLFFLLIMIILVTLSLPLKNAKFGSSDYHILPETSSAREFFDVYNKNYNPNELKSIDVIVTTDHGKVLTKQNIGRIYELGKRLKEIPAVEQVSSIVNTDTSPKLSKSQYEMLYTMSSSSMSKPVKTLLQTTTHDDMTDMTIVSKYPADSAQTKDLIQQLRTMNPGPGLKIQVAGDPVSDIDVLSVIWRIFPYAVIWIMVCTFIILLFLLRSLFLPFKAVVMTILSLCASYGVLVYVIQEGYFSHLLNFEPQQVLDISLLIIIFCALFGFSTDYEVFLLSRIQECHEQTSDVNKSIIFGVEQSSRIITSAALIVIVICASFMVADVLMIKAFGLGIAVAIFTDAFLIRSLLVPATMAIVGKFNWYLPRWLDRILPKI